jgi:hypothetical protein
MKSWVGTSSHLPFPRLRIAHYYLLSFIHFLRRARVCHEFRSATTIVCFNGARSRAMSDVPNHDLNENLESRMQSARAMQMMCGEGQRQGKPPGVGKAKTKGKDKTAQGY